MAITDNPQNFSETNNCGSSVAAGSNCSIKVTFTPTSPYANTYNGTVTITDNANPNSQSVVLIGNGIPAATPPGTYAVHVNANVGTDQKSVPVTVNVQ